MSAQPFFKLNQYGRAVPLHPLGPSNAWSPSWGDAKPRAVTAFTAPRHCVVALRGARRESAKCGLHWDRDSCQVRRDLRRARSGHVHSRDAEPGDAKAAGATSMRAGQGVEAARMRVDADAAVA